MFDFLKKQEFAEIARLKELIVNDVEKIQSLENKRSKLQNDLFNAHAQIKEERAKIEDIKARAARSHVGTVEMKNKHIRQLETYIVTLVKLFSKRLKKSEEAIYAHIPEYRRFQLCAHDEFEIEQSLKMEAKTLPKVDEKTDGGVVDGVRLDKENTEFYRAVELAKSGTPLIYLTGKAGSGKSTFLKYLKQINDSKNVVVLAPTGVAAMNVGGQTIHSFFRLPLSVFIPNDSRFRKSAPPEDSDQSVIHNHFPYSSTKIQLIRKMDILVIDEVSMVRCDILDSIDRLLRHFRNSEAPFGGVQTILIGDAFQLAPIATDDEWVVLNDFYKTPYFFDAEVLRNSIVEYIELKKIYRQKDIGFINVLNKVRVGEMSDKDIDILNSKYDQQFKPKDGDTYIILTTHNEFVREYNRNKLNELPSEIKCYEAAVIGNFPEKLMPTDKLLYLKVGAQVMFVKNDKGDPRRYYNGKIGTVKAISDNIITVICEDGEDIEVAPDEWMNNVFTWDRAANKINTNEKGRFSQFPLKLAWAITVHKSQGLGFDKVIADLSGSFAPGQVYVALSRCTSFDGLKLISEIPKHAIQTDQNVIEFSIKNGLL